MFQRLVSKSRVQQGGTETGPTNDKRNRSSYGRKRTIRVDRLLQDEPEILTPVHVRGETTGEMGVEVFLTEKTLV